MFNQQIPLISASAGPGNDGVVVGSIAQSNPTAVLGDSCQRTR